VAAYAVIENGSIHLRGFVGSADGRRAIRLEERAPLADDRVAGLALAQRALADGAAALLGG
jgi:hydroxymethylbilane synthase